MSINLKGIIAALPTPFSDKGDLAPEKLQSNLEIWNRTDLLGYLILGSTGEFPHLTLDERLAVIETVRDATPSDKLLLVGTGELSTRGTIEVTRQAAERGADAAVVVTPFYYKRLLDEEHLTAHYLRVADKSSIPILIYLIPQFSGVYLSAETIAKLAEHENIVGLKDSSGDLPALEELFRLVNTDEFNILMGAPTLLKQSLEAGAAGGVLAVGCIAPNACVALERSCRIGEGERTVRLQERLLDSLEGPLPTVSDTSRRRSILSGFTDTCRARPLPSPTAEQRAEIEAAISESGFFEREEYSSTWNEVVELGDLEYAD